MYCIKSIQQVEIVLSKSRFIGVIAPCANEQDVLFELKRLHAEHPTASHIAYAYRIKTEHGIVYRFHDAGEPTGTAGKPIFQHLDGKDLINLVIVVIRYFGGIKLGAGGLTRAYGNTAKLAIETAEVHPYIERVQIALTLDYQHMQALVYLLKKLDGQILYQDFAGQIRLIVELPATEADTLLASFSGSVQT